MAMTSPLLIEADVHAAAARLATSDEPLERGLAGPSAERRGGPAGAIVRPLAVVRCDLDLPMTTAGLFPGPFAVGHETVAEAVAIGNHVRDRKPGDRV